MAIDWSISVGSIVTVVAIVISQGFVVALAWATIVKRIAALEARVGLLWTRHRMDEFAHEIDAEFRRREEGRRG